MLDITSAQFEEVEDLLDPGWVMRVVAEGTGFVMGARPLVGAVGDVPLESVVTHPEMDGFVGFLREVPQVGATLRIGYMDEELLDTEIAFDPAIS